MRALSSSMVFSSSGNFGGSPVSRPSVFLAKSQVICTCLTNGNMSGVSRVCNSTASSIFFAAQCAAALSRIFERAPRVWRKDCVPTLEIVSDVGIPWQEADCKLRSYHIGGNHFETQAGVRKLTIFAIAGWLNAGTVSRIAGKEAGGKANDRRSA